MLIFLTIKERVAVVPLNHGRYAIVDVADLPLIQKWKWRVSRSANDSTKYAVRTLHYPGGRHGQISIHRQILGASDGQIIDHRDGDGLNNTRANIRFATVIQNVLNTRKTWGRSKFRGVSKNLKGTVWCWRGHIKRNGKQYFLGNFKDEESAARAYDLRAIEFYGSDARLNFPGGKDA